jgi:hypothetical protein
VKITFEVGLTDGTRERVSTVYADILALEDKFDIDASELMTRQRAKWLAFLAWSAMKRDQKTTDSFDEFTKKIEDLSPVLDGQGNDE